MRRAVCTVLAVAALAFHAGPAGAQVISVDEGEVAALAPSIPFAFDDGGTCTGVPDTIPGIFDFTGACAAHDACYASGAQTQARCDDRFLQDMVSACLVQHPDAWAPARYACFAFAYLYYLGVSFFGQLYF